MDRNQNEQPEEIRHGPIDLLMAHAAWLVLFASILATLTSWGISVRTEDARAKERFDARVEEIRHNITDRLHDYEHVLLGGAGLLAAKPNLSDKDWKNYVDKLKLQANYPGVQGFGYAAVVTPSNIDTLLSFARKPAHTPFRFWPEGNKNLRTAILYLEPAHERNLHYLGFDMNSAPVLHAAMLRARDTGLPIASGRTNLDADNTFDAQLGFTLFVPIYQPGTPLNSVAARQSAIVGYVFCILNMRELMRGIMGSRPTEIDLEIYFGKSLEHKDLIYDSDFSRFVPSERDRHFEARLETDFLDGTWTLHLESLSDFDYSVNTGLPRLLLVAGLLISLLLFGLTLTLTRTRMQALTLAHGMTSALRSSEQHLLTVLETAPDGVITTSATGVILSANPAACRIFDRSKTDLVGLPLARLLSPAGGSILETFYKDLAGPQNSPQTEAGPSQTISSIQGKNPDGREFPLELTLGVAGPEGSTLVVVIARDMTRQYRLDRMKNEFVSVVSHELRTPLTAIKGSLGLILGGATGALSAKSRELIRIAASNSDRLLSIINDILDVDKIESGKMTFEMTEQDLNEIVRQAATANSALAERQGTGFQLELTPSSMPVLGDASRLGQVMANLLSNAVKFSPAGLPVVIRTDLHEGRARVQVSDKGPGIPEAFQPRVFEKFSQADSSDSRRKGGTGLGLSIARAIVERHSGKIYFISQPGTGATFFFELPLYRPHLNDV